MDFSRLCRQQDLAWLHTDVDPFDSSESKVTSWPVQHNGATCIDHVCLEQHLVDDAVVVHNIHLGLREVQSPIAQVLVDDIDSMVLKG